MCSLALALMLTNSRETNSEECERVLDIKGPKLAHDTFDRCVSHLMTRQNFPYGSRMKNGIWLVSANEPNGVRGLHYWSSDVLQYAKDAFFKTGDFILHGKHEDRLTEVYVGATNLTALQYCVPPFFLG